MTGTGQVVTVLGATRNFFKVGHYTLRRLAADAPQLTLRLAIPDAPIAGRAVADLAVQLRDWIPGDAASLADALAGTDIMLMVPPIDRRMELGGMYVEAARKAGVRQIVCLGIQFTAGQCAMADEAAALEKRLEDSGIPFDVVQLPMFLENILYQCQSIAQAGTFTFPVDPDRPFSYITCDDAAELFCLKILNPRGVDLGGVLMGHTVQADCAGWAAAIGDLVGRPVTFVRQGREHFVTSLARYGMSRQAAEQVFGLWERIGSVGDAIPTPAAATLLGRPCTDMAAWTRDHACCFRPGFASCPHPHPPVQHMFGPA